MTTLQRIRTRILVLLLGAAALASVGSASADPPSRVARLSYATGAVSFSPAGEDDWMQARINRPLIAGDRLWTDAGARAEIQLGGAMIRMNAGTGVSILNLDDRIAQLELTQGTLNVRVRRLEPGQVFEIDTPNLAFVLRQPGEYRIDVDPEGDATTIVVRNGRGEVYGDGAAYTIAARQRYRFAGTDLRQYDHGDAARFDEFDRWCSGRDRRGAVSARYVSPYVIGYEDLDEYGSWRTAEGYGNVWMPNRVASDWAPYRDGHWSWVEPWGWTWVDDAPWGFAVSHYGRWANINGAWGWIPGPVRSQAVYAPALVAFIVGAALQSAFSSDRGGIAWFPLGPRDVYRPSYPVSRNYFNNINTSNTTIHTTNITNVYNNVNVRNITYVNQQVPGAIVAVPSTAFVQSQPVARAAVPLSREAIARAPVTAVAEVAPVQASVRGAAAPARKPPAEAQRRPVVAKAPPPPAPVPFAAKQSALAAQPGRPLDAAALTAVKPAAPAPAPSVKVITPAQPAAAPPPRREAAAPGAPRTPEATKGRQTPEAQAPPPPVSAPKPPETQAPPPPVSAPKAPEAQKAAPEGQKGRSREAEKAPPAVSVPKPPEAPKASPPVIVPKPPEAQAPPPPVSTPKAPEAQKAAPDAQKGRPREVEKALPPVSVPKPPEAQAPPPPVSAPKAPEVQKAAPEVQKGRSREAEKAPPAVSVPSSPEAPKAPPPVTAPKPPEPQAPPPPVSAPKAPEAQKAAPEVQKGRSREVETAPPPAVTPPKPPVAPKAPPSVSVPKPPEVPKAPPPVSAPTPPDAQKATPPKPEAGKSGEKRGEKKSDEQLKLEQKLRLEEKLKREEEDKKRQQ